MPLYKYKKYIYIYKFSRSFYLKRLTVHSGYFLSVCVFSGNWTHNLCAANAMLYHWATGTCWNARTHAHTHTHTHTIKTKNFLLPSTTDELMLLNISKTGYSSTTEDCSSILDPGHPLPSHFSVQVKIHNHRGKQELDHTSVSPLLAWREGDVHVSNKWWFAVARGPAL